MRRQGKWISAGLLTIALASCFVASVHLTVPVAAYEKAFDAALTAGIQAGYIPKYQDKSNRVIQFEQLAGQSRYQISVTFVPEAAGELLAKIAGSVDQSGGNASPLDAINPFVQRDVEKIQQAIVGAGGSMVK